MNIIRNLREFVQDADERYDRAFLEQRRTLEICKECAGTGQTLDGETCPSCGGLGVRPMAK